MADIPYIHAHAVAIKFGKIVFLLDAVNNFRSRQHTIGCCTKMMAYYSYFLVLILVTQNGMLVL